MKKFLKVNSKNADVQALSESVASSFNDIEKIQELDRIVLDNVTLTTTTKILVHGLGRPIQGWEVVRNYSSTFGGIWETKNYDFPERFIHLATVSGVFSGSLRVW